MPIGTFGPTNEETARVLLARAIDVDHALCREPPPLDVLIEAKRALHDENGALRNERTILLPRFFEHRRFESCAAIVQREDHAPAALADVEDHARDRHGLALEAKSLVCGRRRPIAGHVCDPPAHDRTYLRFEFLERMARQVKPKGVTLSFEPHAAAPLGQRLGFEGRTDSGARIQ